MNNQNLSFCSVYDRASTLRFDRVVGKGVYHHFPMHIHDSLCVGLIVDGEREMTLMEGVITVGRNEMFVINPDQPHAITDSRPHDYIVITVKGAPTDVAFENVIDSDECRELFCGLSDALVDGDVSMIDERWHSLYACLAADHRRPATPTVQEDFVRRSLEYIRLNYRRQIRVEEIAAHACMSTFHFSRLFKSSTGLSPHNYLVQYRLARSREGLRGNTSVFDTAIDTGFYDSSHFVRTFHSHMAVSPKRFRESTAEK